MHEKWHKFDHSIFVESIRFIRTQLGDNKLDPLQQQVLERLIHSSGDFEMQSILRFSSGACEKGVAALKAGAPILTDTEMAAAAVKPMACRTLNSSVSSVLDWAPSEVDDGSTRTAVGIKRAWLELSKQFFGPRSPIVLIGSAPKALEELINLISYKATDPPSLIIAMPVGFIGVAEAKNRLSHTNYPQIRLDGSRGGAGLAAATINALLRASIDIH